MRGDRTSSSTRGSTRGHLVVAMTICVAGVGALARMNFSPSPSALRQAQTDHSYSINQREIKDLTFVDSLHGWIVASDNSRREAYLYSTTDGGKSWSVQPAPRGLYRITFVNPRVGWGLAMLNGPAEPPLTSLLRTETGGDVWSTLPNDGLARANRDGFLPVALGFADLHSGWIIGAGAYNTGMVLKTSDGGRTALRLSKATLPVGAPMGLVVREATVWIYGVEFAICSQDGGRTWGAVDAAQFGTTHYNFNMNSGFLNERGQGWLAGNAPDPTILSTDDGGKHWKLALRTKESGRTFEAISSWDSSHVCAVEGPTLLYCSPDGGANWSARDVIPKPEIGQADFFLNLVMLASGRGWALRAGGYLYATSDGGRTWESFDPAAGRGSHSLADAGLK